MEAKNFVQCTKLEGSSNWTDWNFEVNSLFVLNDCAGIFDNSIVEPKAPAEGANEKTIRDYNQALKAYEKANAKAAVIIRTNVSANVLNLIRMHGNSALAIWNELLSNFEKVSSVKLDTLLQKFFTFRIEKDENVMQSLARLRTLWVDLQREQELSGEGKLPQNLLAPRILSILPDEEYLEFKSQWDSAPKSEKSPEKLIEQINMRLQRRNQELRNDSTITFVANANHGAKHGGKKWKKGGKRLQDSNQPQPLPTNNAKTMNRFSKTGGGVKVFNGICFRCNKPGHIGKFCPVFPDMPTTASGKTETFFANTQCSVFVCQEDDCDRNVWIKDDGATAHITNSAEYFKTYRHFDKQAEITVGNKQTIPAYGCGDIDMCATVGNIQKSIVLTDVLYAPEIGKNLLSASKVMKRGISNFGDSDDMICRFFRKKTPDNILLEAPCTSNGLFELRATPIKPQRGSAAVAYFVNNEMTTPCPETALTMTSKLPLSLWHRRLGHQGVQYVKQYLRQNGIDFIDDRPFCEACVYGKQSRRTFKPKRFKTERSGEIIHADLLASPVLSRGGKKYMLVIKDDYSKFRNVEFLKHKDEAVDKIKQFLVRTNKDGVNVKELVIDGGREFNNAKLMKLTEDVGIKLRITMPYTPEQNGLVERENRTIMDAVRTMLKDTGLPQFLWAEAASTAVYVLNRTGPSKSTGKSPFEEWFGRKPSINKIRIFGSATFVHVPNVNRGKLDDKAIKGYLVGYCDDDGYRVFIPSMNDTIKSTNVMFNEKQIGPTSKPLEMASNTDTSSDMTFRILDTRDDVDTEESGDLCTDEDEPTQITTFTLRDRSTIQRPTRFNDYDVYSSILKLKEPETYDEAMRSSEYADWKRAMDEEMASHAKHGTWQLIEPPNGRKILDNRWVYRVKTNPDGSVERFKARLVAKGYTQTAKIDYEETFSPVCRYDTIRALIATAAKENLELFQIDVETAFLYGDLTEEIYMHQPKGYDDGSKRVCKMLRPLYGLKQAGRCWNTKFTDVLKKHGMIQSKSDNCLFIRNDHGHKMLMAIYVDDGIVAVQDKAAFFTFMDELRKHFKIRVTKLNCFLGLQVEHLKNGSLFLHQEAFTKKIIERFGDAKTSRIPIKKSSLKVNYSQPTDDGMIKIKEAKPLGSEIPYRSVVGSLLYLAMGTRPDIAYAVSLASRKLDNPTDSDWEIVQTTLRYLRNTIGHGIVYNNDDDKSLVLFSDADNNSCPETRRSRTGVVSFYGGGVITWRSKLQEAISNSTTEAEFMAAADATKDLIWLKRLFAEIANNVSLPILQIDNQSTIKYIKNPMFHARTKHIDQRYKFVQDEFSKGHFQLGYVRSDEQRADILTKALPAPQFHFQKKLIGVKTVDMYK